MPALASHSLLFLEVVDGLAQALKWETDPISEGIRHETEGIAAAVVAVLRRPGNMERARREGLISDDGGLDDLLAEALFFAYGAASRGVSIKSAVGNGLQRKTLGNAWVKKKPTDQGVTGNEEPQSGPRRQRQHPHFLSLQEMRDRGYDPPAKEPLSRHGDDVWHTVSEVAGSVRSGLNNGVRLAFEEYFVSVCENLESPNVSELARQRDAPRTTVCDAVTRFRNGIKASMEEDRLPSRRPA